MIAHAEVAFYMQEQCYVVVKVLSVFNMLCFGC